VVDYRLPDMTRETLLFSLRQYADLHAIPVILFGTALQREELKHCLQPYDTFLPVPFRAVDLLEQIDLRIHREFAAPAAG
jgi:CheY-like chemotaxis protein